MRTEIYLTSREQMLEKCRKLLNEKHYSVVQSNEKTGFIKARPKIPFLHKSNLQIFVTTVDEDQTRVTVSAARRNIFLQSAPRNKAEEKFFDSLTESVIQKSA